MQHHELVDLIRAGVRHSNGTWADFGAGRGNFTLALHDLLDDDAVIYAIDKDRGALRALKRRWPGSGLTTIVGDFTRALELPPLNGLLMANALHWNRQQERVLRTLYDYLKAGGEMLIVEYEVQRARSFIPHPVPFERLRASAAEVGFRDIQQVGYRQSPRTGLAMYAAVALKGNGT
jgi:ubiquinone/menaquinone biosynthesis C-methylase UbiE